MIPRMMIGLCLTIAVLPVARPAFAYTAYGGREASRWAAADKCTAAAIKAFPDVTADSLAKRDLQLKQCLAAGNLPPRAPIETTQPPKP